MINIFRLNLACLAVGSTVCGETLGKALNRLNLACLAVGSTFEASVFHARTAFRLNLACLAVGSTNIYIQRYIFHSAASI